LPAEKGPSPAEENLEPAEEYPSPAEDLSPAVVEVPHAQEVRASQDAPKTRRTIPGVAFSKKYCPFFIFIIGFMFVSFLYVWLVGQVILIIFTFVP
jgi:hypothetical protein